MDCWTESRTANIQLEKSYDEIRIFILKIAYEYLSRLFKADV